MLSTLDGDSENFIIKICLSALSLEAAGYGRGGEYVVACHAFPGLATLYPSILPGCRRSLYMTLYRQKVCQHWAINLSEKAGSWVSLTYIAATILVMTLMFMLMSYWLHTGCYTKFHFVKNRPIRNTSKF